MDVGDIRTALVSTVGITVKRRTPVIVRRDRATGGWLTKSSGGTLISDNPRGPSWSRCRADTYDLFLRGYEPRPGDVVVELGAGTGTETVILAQLVGPTGRVVACEASPRAAELLRATLAANGLRNVDVVEVAILDRRGHVTLHEHGHEGSIRSTLMDFRQENAIRVPADTLDAVLAGLEVERVDLLKVNIEGAERMLIASMEESLPKVRNAVVSCHDFIADKLGEDSYRTREEVAAFFRSAGFEVTSRDADPSRPWLRDYIFVRRA